MVSRVFVGAADPSSSDVSNDRQNDCKPKLVRKLPEVDHLRFITGGGSTVKKSQDLNLWTYQITLNRIPLLLLLLLLHIQK